MRVTERAAPGIKNHHRLRAGGNLCIQVGGDGVGQYVHQMVRGFRLFKQQRLGAGEGFAAATFNHVGGQRPRAAGKTDQRHLAIQLAANQRHRIGDIFEFVARVERAQFVDVGNALQRRFEFGAFAFGKIQAQSHGVGNGENIGKQYRGVEVETA